MSSCPTIDLHSVYIDGELPPQFMARYESHIKTCSLCSARLAAFKKLHDALAADSNSITLSDAYKEQGFSRLQTKLRYSKTVSSISNKSELFKHTKSHLNTKDPWDLGDSPRRFSKFNYQNVTKVLAMAAVFAIAFTAGLKLQKVQKTSDSPTVAQLKPITRPRLQMQRSAMSGTQNVYFTQDGYQVPLFSRADYAASSADNNMPYQNDTMVLGAPSMGLGLSANNKSTHHFVEFADVDVFRPTFDTTYNEQVQNATMGQYNWGEVWANNSEYGAGIHRGHHHE